MFRPDSLRLAGRRWRCRRRSGFVPDWWVPVQPSHGRLSGRRLFTWPYVLQALRLPFRLVHLPWPVIWMPVFLAPLALRNLEEFEAEERRPRAFHAPAEEPHAWLTAVILLPLVLLHLARMTGPWTGLPEVLAGLLPAQAGAWPAFFGLDSVRTPLFGEWSRCVTALFVHADVGHLAANGFFALLFCRFLGNRTGAGLALLLTLAGGSLANGLSVFLRESYVLSVGFSTALFASVGALSGFVSRRSKPGALLPLAAGAALLALLGTEGENTDYTAHLCGLVCGMTLGFLAAWAAEKRPALLGARWQCVFFLLALLLPPTAFALRKAGF